MMFNGERSIKLVRSHAKRKLRRGDTSKDWAKIIDVTTECLDDDGLCMPVSVLLEVEARKRGHNEVMDADFVAGCVDDPDCNCKTSQDVELVASACFDCCCVDCDCKSILTSYGVAGDLGDGKLMDQLLRFFNWLLDPETVDKLINLIEKLIQVFVGIGSAESGQATAFRLDHPWVVA